MVKSRLPLREPELNSQHPGGGSQLSVTPVPGDPTVSSGLTRHTHGKHTYIQTEYIFKIIMVFMF